ncbi:MAG: glycosyltransferase family 4 protein [Candidatus Pacebacteria bacterium]|nr:glycosyltransferase family 4 protein [Candidatus Paceibacterota bacterium]
MKVSLLAPNLSSNSTGRAYILAKVLQRKYEVEIIGPLFGKEIWRPISNDLSIHLNPININKNFRSVGQFQELYSKIKGDVIYAIKPLFPSFGVGLVKKIFTKKPLVLDIDDWELGFFNASQRKTYFLKPYNNLRFLAAFISEKTVKFADEITVSNSFLKEKFGGNIIYHGRDTDYLDPALFDRKKIRNKYKIEPSRKVLMFLGTPQPYKGIEDVVDALPLVRSKNLLLFIVGIDNKSEYCRELTKLIKKRLKKDQYILYGLQPFEKIPEFLSLADIVIIPQRKEKSTLGQTPAKIFDAMAMAKPIISTNVSDIPEILDDCGWVVEPHQPTQIANTITYILNNYAEAEEIGLKARKKCIQYYSWDAMEKNLNNVFRKYEKFF